MRLSSLHNVRGGGKDERAVEVQTDNFVIEISHETGWRC